MALEINLVPDIKDEMIKTLKIRNYIFFACIVVAIASVAVTAVFGLIAGAQELARDGKKSTIDNLSAKLSSYTDLNDSLTIRDQLGNLESITKNKRVFSRTFNALSAFIPTGADTITISELDVKLGSGDNQEDVDLEREQPTLTITGQANAGREPYIDYNVLDSFKKSMKYMRYDYGRYVDKEGNTIPSYCMIEQGSDGATLTDDKGIFAYWTINAEGCNPSDTLKDSDYKHSMEKYDNVDVVKVYRTPLFTEWYTETPKENEPSMTDDGTIANVPHFESECITYRKDNSVSETKFTDDNRCRLVLDENEPENENLGIEIVESSNGRDSSEQLVLRFIAEVYMAPEFFDFNNTHMRAIAPSGRRNVTDSYVQVQAMFGKRAKDCAKDDTACINSNNSNNDNSSEDDSDNKKSSRNKNSDDNSSEEE